MTIDFKKIVLPALALLVLSCSLWEYDDPSAAIGNLSPETYLTLVAADTIYRVLDQIIEVTDTVSGIVSYDSTWTYSIGVPPADTAAFIGDTLGNAFTTITTSQQLLNWWGEDQDGNVVAYDVRWNTDSSWTRTAAEDSLFNVPIRTVMDVFQFFVRAVDDSGAVDLTPAMLTFPIKNSFPSIEFRYGSNPQKADHGTVSYTFSTRTFVWDLFDLDGIETITNVYYALDDTCDTCWIALDAQAQSSLTLTGLEPGTHKFFLKARDIAGAESPVIRFPDSDDEYQCQRWEVKPVVGDVLLVDDFPFNISNVTRNWYKNILDTLVGTDGYSVWEIGGALPYSSTDILATLDFFDHVIWFSGVQGVEMYLDASSSIYSYAMGGGNFFISAPELKDSTFIWFPLKSQALINPSGRWFPGARIDSQVDNLPDLVTSYTIGVRVRSFVPDATQFASIKDLYHLSLPRSSDEWTGTPNVCSIGQFQASFNQLSGKVVLLSLPLHNGSQPLLEGEGSASQLLEYLLFNEFGR
ncbi:MAG: hypothetical protein ABIA75_01070 [Candidatus Neomarinimicrobiota bacterium]